MASNTSDQSLPRNIRGWKKLARIWNVSGGINQLGSPVPVRSASKFEFKQFLGLQVIYEFPKVRSRLPIQITKQFPSSGDSDLENLSGWNAYLGEVEKFDIHLVTQSSAAQTSVPRTLGSLVNVWQFQLHVLLGDEAAADPNKISEVTPVAHRTRAQTLKRDPYSTPNPTARFKDLPLVDRVSEMSLEDDNFEGEAEEGIEEEEDISDDGTAERLGTLSDNDDEADPGMWPPKTCSFYGSGVGVTDFISEVDVPGVLPQTRIIIY